MDWSRLADSLMCMFVCFPSLLMTWRGMWDILSVYIFPENQLLSHLVQTAAGCCSVIVGFFIFPVLGERLRKVNNRWMFQIGTYASMYLYAVLFLSLWRGVWGLLDLLVMNELWRVGVSVAVFHGLCIMFRCVRCTMWPPLLTVVDNRDSMVPVTRFGTKPGISVAYVCDSLYTGLILTSVVIGDWRNIYTLVSLLSQTENPTLGDIICFCAGMAGVIILHLLQIPMVKTATWLNSRKYMRTSALFEAVVYTVATFTLVTTWKGLWNLNSRYLLPDPHIGGWVCHLIGVMAMMFFGIFGLIGSPGCFVDGQDDPEITYLHLHYFRNKSNNIMKCCSLLRTKEKDVIETTEKPEECTELNTKQETVSEKHLDKTVDLKEEETVQKLLQAKNNIDVHEV